MPNTPLAVPQISHMHHRLLTESLSQTASSQNHISGLSYDIAGNVLNDGYGNTPTYDAENRIATDAGVTYYYDADGVRMEKSSGTMYWPSTSGQYLTETNITGTINEEYIYFNGARIARVDRPSGLAHYYFSNHLGSHSMVTNATGGCEQDIDYYPYGFVIADHCPNVAQHYKFTSKERDTESGLDQFGARYYASTIGRFMTPDLISGTPVHLINPQRWNMYSYVVNDPLTYVDPDGMDAIAVNFTKEVPGGGHEGIVSVEDNGNATYARFGPIDANSPNDPGKVLVQSLAHVAFRSDGLPTDESYKQIGEEVAKIEGQNSDTVRMNYFKTSSADTGALIAWMDRIARNAPHYNVCSQNCATFTRAGLIVAGAISDTSRLSNIPNVLFNELTALATENYSHGQRTPKEIVTHRICYPDDKGDSTCQ
jgi:RHS repeat-associated protein